VLVDPGFVPFWCAQLVVNDGRAQMNEISRSNVFSLLSANQRLLERLEAENARLRCSVVELTLEIQALREALSLRQSESHPTSRYDKSFFEPNLLKK
jgi:hypothetical protein